MPTGYTCDLSEEPDITLEKFALRCARAFGALIEMRDLGPEAKIPEKFTPDRYEVNAMRDAKKQLVEAHTRTLVEWREQYERDVAGTNKAYEEAGKKARQWRKVCEALIAKVTEWVPPSEQHVDLKRFMLEQLNETLHYDGEDPDPKTYTIEPFGKWRKRQIQNTSENVTYAEEALARAEKRAAERTEWVQQLRASLKDK